MANGKIIIITPDDTIKSMDYVNWETLQQAVGGNFEHFHSDKLEIPMFDNIPISFWCNEEFLIRDDEKFDKINAVATLLCGQEIRGDVAVSADENSLDGVRSRGFKYAEEENDGEIEEAICEHWFAEDTFMLFINRNKDAIRKVHEELDNKKARPTMKFIAME